MEAASGKIITLTGVRAEVCHGNKVSKISIHISILGTCVMRDVFRVMDGAGKYKVDRYVQAVNPIAAVGSSPLLQEVPDWSGEYFDSEINSFNRRNAYMDLKKSVFSYLAEAKSDYLLIDIGDIRIDLCFFDKERQKSATSFSVKRGGKVMQEKYLPSVLETTSVLELDDSFVREQVEAYLERILTLYPQEKIILFENYAVDAYYNRIIGGVKHSWEDTSKKFNQTFEKVFPYCLAKLPRAHVIPFPAYVLGDEKHIWGSYPLHYLDGYYQYGFEAVEAIVKAKNREEEAGLLRRLRSKWEEVFCVESKMLAWFDLARIDIKNQGEGNDVKIKVIEGKRNNLYQADWFSKGGAGYVLETYDRNLVLELECCGTGKLLVRLQGIDRLSPNGIRLPIWVDYKRLVVNEEIVFWGEKPQWHDQAYVFNREVEDGEIIKVEISWDRHGYRGTELAKLISLWQKGEKACI